MKCEFVVCDRVCLDMKSANLEQEREKRMCKQYSEALALSFSVLLDFQDGVEECL
jgi:hypothetical protein